MFFCLFFLFVFLFCLICLICFCFCFCFVFFSLTDDRATSVHINGISVHSNLTEKQSFAYYNRVVRVPINMLNQGENLLAVAVVETAYFDVELELVRVFVFALFVGTFSVSLFLNLKILMSQNISFVSFNSRYLLSYGLPIADGWQNSITVRDTVEADVKRF